jgi:hypothetical protein
MMGGRRSAAAGERMFYLLLFFSIVTLGAGGFVIAFGVAIRDTTFGVALLISGTVAVVGGFLLIGLAVAFQELRRMVLMLRRIPGGPRPLRPPERKNEFERRPPPQRPAFPGRPGPDASLPMPESVDESAYETDYDDRVDPGPRAQPGVRSELPSRHEPAAREEQHVAERDPSPAWLRRAIAEIESVPRPAEAPVQIPMPVPVRAPAPAYVEPIEPPRYEEPVRRPAVEPPEPLRFDEPVRRPVPLEAASGRPGAAATDRIQGQDAWFRGRAAAMPAPMPPMPAPAPVTAEAPKDFTPEPEPRRQAVAPAPNIFDMVWNNDRRRTVAESAPPPEPRADAPTIPAIRPVEARNDLRVEQRNEPRNEPRAAPALQPVPAPVSPPRAEPRPEAWPEPRQETRPEPGPEPHPEPRPEPRTDFRPEPRPEYRPEPRPEPRPLSILKSGVIDEMAYTLFTDGSIEAQMPDGIMRFSSIDDLRRHLDRSDN